MYTGIDPHAYTSGGWLRHDRLERDSRYITFNFDALCRRVVELCPGAASITTYDKKEGGFNRVFIFTTDNAKRVVARLPFVLAGPPRLTTSSEVATIEYLQTNTSIPIPKILDWSNDASNSIGSEYIIMEHAAGVQLHQRWPTMAGDQQVRCINAIYQKVKEMVDIKFPAYGSLYFVDAPLDSGSKQTLNKRFCIGPHCGAIYWNCNVGESRYYHNTKPNQGPWPDLTAYCDGLIDTGLSRVPPVDPVPHNQPRYRGSVEAHLRLLESGRAAIKKMSEDPRIRDAAAPTLLQPDLHKRNIFVSDDDPAVITGIIDWQSSSIEPAFWYADDVPDFASPVAHPSLENQLEPNSERCAKAFDVCSQFLVPKLSGPRLIDEGLFRPFRYCYRTWKDGLVAFRHELIETSLRWKELGLVGSCPFHPPTPEELAIHQKEYRTFEAAQDLKNNLSSLLNTASDGWVPQEEWEATELAHREMFNGMLQAVLTNESPDDDEPIKDEEDLRAIWPFDI
ncbi:kinase-like domain-containing protein [Rhexocercosporidium sp. MPI-PUGE-AT-0058]|nr:kinase-like domain-containing protein [Rhexocercosporidium sp. MPI-PUGE-AT-0058]